MTWQSSWRQDLQQKYSVQACEAIQVHKHGALGNYCRTISSGLRRIGSEACCGHKEVFCDKNVQFDEKANWFIRIDDITAKCQSLQRSLHQIEEDDTFGDEMEQDEVSEEGSEASVTGP